MSGFEAAQSLKAARAVYGDDIFMERFKVMCIIEDIPVSERLALIVAYGLHDKITVDEHLTVDTHGVTDNNLKTKLKSEWGKIKPPELELEGGEV